MANTGTQLPAWAGFLSFLSTIASCLHTAFSAWLPDFFRWTREMERPAAASDSRQDLAPRQFVRSTSQEIESSLEPPRPYLARETERPAAASDSGQDIAPHQFVRSTSQEIESSLQQPPRPYFIFLSHSGKQKPFVEELDRDLKRAGHHTFFDLDSDSLPIGDRFPDRIKQKASTCALGVVVLSKEFLTSKWPVLELCYLCDSKRALYPLFYKLSVEDCKSPENRRSWSNEWDRLAAQDERIDPQRCLRSLEALLKWNGESFRPVSEVNYRRDIVSKICKRWPPHAQFDDSDLQGKDRMCKEIVDKFNNAAPFCKKAFEACVISLYGVGGSGKTSVCKTMVDFYRPEYVGKAFLLELPLHGNEIEILGKCKDAAKILTEASSEVLNSCYDLSQVIRLLKERLENYRVFLAIDNVSEQSEGVAAKILDTSFCSGTKVLVTSRSSELLRQMLRHGCDNERCHHAVPSMDRDEAIAAFLHYANDKDIAKIWSNKLDRVVDMARFEERWHPLMLRALGRKLGKRYRENSLDTFFSVLPYGGKEGADVLRVLKSSYDEIADEGRKLIFLDVAVILPCVLQKFPRIRVADSSNRWMVGIFGRKESKIFGYLEPTSLKGICHWLSTFHGDRSYSDLEEDLRQLQYDGLIDVQRKDELLRADEYNDQVLQIHDLYVELAERVVADDPRFLYSDRADKEPERVEWANLERIVLQRDGCNGEMLKVMKTSTCPKVRLLILDRLANCCPPEFETLWLMKVHEMTRLRFVRMRGFSVEGLRDAQKIVWLDLNYCNVEALTNIIEGLTKVQVLQIISCSVLERQPDLRCHGHLKELPLSDSDRRIPILGRSSNALPKLERLNLGEVVNWELRTLPSLRVLDLSHSSYLFELTLEHLTNLQHLHVGNCTRLKTITLRKLITLRTLHAESCSLVRFLHLDDLTSLEVLHLFNCRSLKAIGPLTNLTRLQTLNVSFCSSLEAICPLTNLTRLQTLDASNRISLVELPNLEGLSNLESLNLDGCSRLVSIYPLNVSSKLRELSVEYCCRRVEQGCLSWEIIAGLTRLTNLEEFKLTGCECVVGIPGLTTLANLTTLRICRCRNLQSVFDTTTFATSETSTLADLYGEQEISCLSANLSSLMRISDMRDLANLRSLTFCQCGLEKLELRDLANLTSLGIEKCRSLEKLELRDLANLTSLNIEKCGSLEKLELRDLANLTSLYIEKCGSLEKLEPRDLANFTYLHIKECTSLEKLELRDLANLTSLDIEECGSLEKLEPRDLANLTSLHIKECTSLEKLEPRDLARLTSLYIRGCGSLEELDLRDLSNATCSNLEELSVVDCQLLQAVPLLSASLERMFLIDLSSLKRIPDLSTKLETVAIIGCEALDELPDFSGLTNLRSLLFSFDGMKPSLIDTGSLINLQTLAITSKAVEIVGLRDLSNLRVLALPDDRSLKDIPDLDRSFPKLEELLVSHCSSSPPVSNLSDVRMGWCSLDALTEWTVSASSSERGDSEATTSEVLRHWVWSLMQGGEKSVVVRKQLLSIQGLPIPSLEYRHRFEWALFLGLTFCELWLEGQPAAFEEDKEFEDYYVGIVVRLATNEVSAFDERLLVSVTWAVGVIAALAAEGGELIWRQLQAHETVEKLLEAISDEKKNARRAITLPAAFHYLVRQPKFALQLRQQGVSAHLRHLSDNRQSSRFTDEDKEYVSSGQLHNLYYSSRVLDHIGRHRYDLDDRTSIRIRENLGRLIEMPIDISRWWETTVAYLGDHAEPDFILKVARELETPKSTEPGGSEGREDIAGEETPLDKEENLKCLTSEEDTIFRCGG